MRNLPAEEQLAGDPALARPLCAELGRQLLATNLGNLSPEMGGGPVRLHVGAHTGSRGAILGSRGTFLGSRGALLGSRGGLLGAPASFWNPM